VKPTPSSQSRRRRASANRNKSSPRDRPSATRSSKVGGLFYVFVVGVFAWGPGTGVAIYSIAESSDDVGGPFSCQCIAKQCST
jgi:hypothetical protein